MVCDNYKWTDLDDDFHYDKNDKEQIFVGLNSDHTVNLLRCYENIISPINGTKS